MKLKFIKSKVNKPFGYMRNFDFGNLCGLIGHDLLWIRFYPLKRGVQIIYNTSGLSIDMLKATD